MPFDAVLSLSAAYVSLIVAAAVLLRDRHSFVHRVFTAGMLLFAAEELFRGLSQNATIPEDVVYWQTLRIIVSALVPGVWVVFSMSYGRANSREVLRKWKVLVLGLLAIPFPVAVAFRESFFDKTVLLDGVSNWTLALKWPVLALQLLTLLSSVLIVFNLERTIRSSTGRLRWQIKFMALGVGVLFALQIHLSSQAILYSSLQTSLGITKTLAFLGANLLFAVSLSRSRSMNVEVYFSRVTIQKSLTFLFAGTYLVSIAILVHLARYLPFRSLHIDTLIVFFALTGFAALLLSERFRQNVGRFVTTHFRRPSYDYRRVWMELTERTTSLVDVHDLCPAVARLVSESLEVLSVNIWLADEAQKKLTLAGSTVFSGRQARDLENAGRGAPEFIRFLREQTAPVDLGNRRFAWAEEVVLAGADSFRGSTIRYAMGLHAGGELVGAITLNDDRVGKEALSSEDFAFLETVGAQLAASLLNLKLTARLREVRELEAFQNVSAFFVHDLKNLASRLSLTMHNLPANFDNPEFRTDALQTISRSVAKIDDMCGRVSLIRQNIELRPTECDLNLLLTATLDELKGSMKGVLEQDLRPLPKIRMDSEQIHKTLTNLVMNANEAVNGEGLIRVTTMKDGDNVVCTVSDNGCGISEQFMENSLFKPFHTTKKKGLGIGLFHSKLIVEAHRGRIEVNSCVGSGTEFRVVLPIA